MDGFRNIKQFAGAEKADFCVCPLVGLGPKILLNGFIYPAAFNHIHHSHSISLCILVHICLDIKFTITRACFAGRKFLINHQEHCCMHDL